MSEIKHWKLGWKRCDCVKCDHALTLEQTEENCGWVMWGDHKAEIVRLKAEYAQLRASSFVTAVPSEVYEELKAEVDKLETEVASIGSEYMAATRHYNLLYKNLLAENVELTRRCAEYEDLVSHYKQQRDEAVNDCWRPIETAPDKDRIIICAFNGEIEIIYSSDLCYYPESQYPRCWMPLPKPPAAKDGKPTE